MRLFYILDFLEITARELQDIINSHRTSIVWKKKGDDWNNKINSLLI